MNAEVIICLSSREVRHLVDLVHTPSAYTDLHICGQCGLVFLSGPESAAIEWDSPEKLDCEPAQIQSSAV